LQVLCTCSYGICCYILDMLCFEEGIWDGCKDAVAFSPIRKTPPWSIFRKFNYLIKITYTGNTIIIIIITIITIIIYVNILNQGFICCNFCTFVLCFKTNTIILIFTGSCEECATGCWWICQWGCWAFLSSQSSRSLFNSSGKRIIKTNVMFWPLVIWINVENVAVIEI